MATMNTNMNMNMNIKAVPTATGNDIEADRERSVTVFSKSGPAELLKSIEVGDRAMVDTITKGFLNNRRFLIFIFIVLTMFSGATVGLVALIIARSKDTTTVSNALVSKDTGKPVGVAAQIDSGIISSDMSMEDISSVSHVFFMLGEGRNMTTVSLNVHGFSRKPCDGTICKSKYILTLYTHEAVVLYHGTTAFIANPSTALEEALDYHGVPIDTAHRQLWFWATVRVLRWVWAWYRRYNSARRTYEWVYGQVQQSCDQYGNCY